MRGIAAAGAAGLALVAPSPALAVAPCAGTYTTSAPRTGASSEPAVEIPAADRSTPKTTAKLELKLPGRFDFTLTRGDHEETGEGRWRATDDRVILTGDSITAPAFVVEADEPLREAALRIELDLPNGLSRQYFTVAVRLADGTIVGRGFTDAPFELMTNVANPPVALRVDLAAFALSSPDFALARGGGHQLRVRFAANDLGKLTFADTPLIERDGALMLPRPDGELALRREGRCSAE